MSRSAAGGDDAAQKAGSLASICAEALSNRSGAPDQAVVVLDPATTDLQGPEATLAAGGDSTVEPPTIWRRYGGGEIQPSTWWI
jgi:hypothetical protein